MDTLTIVASLGGAYITGWAIGAGFLAWKRFFDAAVD